MHVLTLESILKGSFLMDFTSADQRPKSHAMNHATVRMTITAVGVALAVLATLEAVIQSPLGVAAPDAGAESIARQELRLEAARASVDARPLLGASHLPPYDARSAVVREESALRRLSSTRTAAR